MYKALNNEAPVYLRELLVDYQPTRALRCSTPKTEIWRARIQFCSSYFVERATESYKTVWINSNIQKKLKTSYF